MVEPCFNEQKASEYFSRIYSDEHRGMTYENPPGLKRPDLPNFPFKEDPPNEEEIKSILKRKRNGAAPGPNGLSYLVYKRLPVIFNHLMVIYKEMWPSFSLPNSKFGITVLISKNELGNEVSDFRPITMTNTNGKILLSLLAKRALTYMKKNNYFDASIQKGYINEVAGCAEHTTLLSELMKNAKQRNRQITVCWTDLENAFGSL